MQERHKNRLLYFNEQVYTTETYVIPFIERHHPVTADCRILEIGCGEGGNLKPFLDRGCMCTGVDLNSQQIDNARTFFAGHPNEQQLTLIADDIYNFDPTDHQYDIIMLRDVIEHIHDQERFMHLLPQYLKPHGVVFLAFPPWYMPFGGHQQICNSLLSKVPYFHILPRSLYRAALRIFGEEEKKTADLLEIKETGITIERFQRILRREHFTTHERVLYFINPNYEIKFHLRPRIALPILRSIPYLRDFYITAAYYLVSCAREDK